MAQPIRRRLAVLDIDRVRRIDLGKRQDAAGHHAGGAIVALDGRTPIAAIITSFATVPGDMLMLSELVSVTTERRHGTVE